ncbi:putative ATPase [Paraburkholderia caballeronis]|uniref:ATP-binding protein n=1 Tax=Paraburkholderia caballeronis TaxID=416943 RepID=UPI0010661791|nr:winged helix-turn-helix domain-containing protein [Paraburkholderia caballeronis]TDV33927.1 putative ATPase [Paraburkholderia caballeronis]
METQALQSDGFSFGATVVVPRRRELLHHGIRIDLGDRAFDLLLVLVESRGSVLSKDRIIAQVWPNRIVEENTLEGQISILRRALGDDRSAIHTVTGRGYQFVGELTGTAPAATGTPVAPTRTPTPAPTPAGIRLPAAISPLIGRAQALRDVGDAMQRHRLVTLVGSGGVGKTRLAIEAARQLAPQFADGVYLAELAATSSADYLPTTLAVALGFPPGDGTASLDRLAATLHTRHLLLLLDNCEHLIESAAQIAERLLQIAPRATIVATSREPLRIAGESVYRVPSLEVPVDEHAADAREFGAIRLFEERAGPDVFACSASSDALQLAVRICRQLDGIPLAIELAAACVPTIGLQGVAERLDDRFQLLTRGARTALPRQQTLRATLDWSYGLLPATQRTVLDRLSVFAGPFSMESAQAVASCDDLAPDAVVGALIELVNKSLVSTIAGPERLRYRLLETTRAYARERLAASGSLDEWSNRHARHFLRVFERAEQQAAQRIDIDWNACYAPHLADLRAAVKWGFSDRGDPQLAVDLTIASIPLSMQLALLEECLARADRALEWLAAKGDPAGEREMKLYAARGMCLLCHTVGPQTSAAFSAALDIATGTGNAAYQLLGLWGRWMCVYLNGQYADALPLSRQFDAVAGASAWTCDRLAAYRLAGMSHLLHGGLDEAHVNLARAASSRIQLPRAQRIRFLYDERMLSHASLALVLWLIGRPGEAMLAARQSLDDARELDHPVSLCYALSEAVCTLAVLTGDEAMLADAVAAMTVETRRHGISTWKARAQMWRGFVELLAGSASAWSEQIYPAMIGIGSKRFYLSLTPFLCATAGLLARHGQVAQALDLIDPAVERATETGDVCSLPELLRTQAELLLTASGSAAGPAAEAMLDDALSRARRHRFVAWELRCATSLAALKQRQGQIQAARELIVPVYRRFAPDLNNRDLDAARALIASLDSGA